MGTYLNRLAHHLKPHGRLRAIKTQKNEGPQFSLRVMQSSGGSISRRLRERTSQNHSVGPSAGLSVLCAQPERPGLPTSFTFDMGGTSTDVALCDSGGIRTTNEASIAGLPVARFSHGHPHGGRRGGSIAGLIGRSLRVALNPLALIRGRRVTAARSCQP